MPSSGKRCCQLRPAVKCVRTLAGLDLFKLAIGNALAEATRSSYIRSEGPLVATLGVDGLIVVATEDVVLVTNRGSDQDIRKIVQILRRSAPLA